MSFLQDLKGVRVLPSAALRDGDINGSFFNKNPNEWPQGYAFGGWIYDAQVSLGFSKRPTQVTLSVVLENDSSINEIQQFDISDRLLQVSLITENGGGGAAWNYQDEFWKGHYYTLELHGITFNRMYLYDYSISVQSGQKTLSVTLKDYSVILDKIYIGLMKRQGPGRVPSTPTNIQPVCGPLAKISKREALLRKGSIATHLEIYCPNCYLMGDGFGPNSDPAITAPYGGNLDGFFQKRSGYIQRDITIGSFIGRPNPNVRNIGIFANNFIDERFHSRYAISKACYLETLKAWKETGGGNISINGQIVPWYHAQSHFATLPNGAKVSCVAPAIQTIPLFSNHAGVPHMDFRSPLDKFDQINTIRYPIGDFWNDLHTRVSTKPVGSSQDNFGFTIDGGFLMLGSEEFAESTCGAVPNVSYNFTELISSLRNRGIVFRGVGDKNPRFRANYIGTLREVLEQWCGVFSLDYYYQDTGEPDAQGFNFLDLEQAARIDPIRDTVDPTTDIGKEFGATNDQKSVIISYRESSTLENTYIQSCITSNVRPFAVKERKKSIKRYVPLLPLHPCDFSIPNFEYQVQESLLGERYEYYKLANFIPWTSNPQNPWLSMEAGWDHRKRMWNRTNRELWDMDVSMALCRIDDKLRDMYVANRICQTALSEQCPQEVYPAGHKKAGDPVLYLQNSDGSAGREATDLDIQIGRETVARRIGWSPEGADHCMDAVAEADLKANFQALGFEELTEIEDYVVKGNIIAGFMKKQEIEDVSLDVSHFKMFLGYYDEQVHEQHKEWEKRCAESMYGFGAIMGGTLPAEPFIPRDYYGVRDGDVGFQEGSCGVSIPKLKNSFEPTAEQYPHYSLEALDAPFKGLLVNSGMYLPTGLHIAKLENPWGTSTEEYDKAFWRVFEDNACKEFNNSLNIIEDAGFNNVPSEYDKNGKPTKWKKQTDQFPFKKQDWNLGMFTPKFFKDAEKIFDEMPGLIQELYTDRRLVDEVSISKRSVEYGSQRYCKKVSLMIITDTRPEAKHPNISFAPTYLGYGQTNSQIRRQRELWEIAEHKRKARDDMRNRCDRDMVYEFCEDAIQRANYPDRAGWGQLNVTNCAVDPTGVYKEGFERELIGGYLNLNGSVNQGIPNSRTLNILLKRNPNVKGFIPTSEDGEYHLMDLEQDMDMLEPKTLNFNIIYPVNNYKMTKRPGDAGYDTSVGGVQHQGFDEGVQNNIGHQFYSGIWTADQTLEDRMPELVEIYGNPPASHNPTAGIRVVNNTIDPDLGAILDPDRGGFITQMYDNEGEEIQSIEGYHNYIAFGDQWGDTPLRGGNKGLNDFSVIMPNKKIDLSLAGSLKNFPNFISYCDPAYGLQDLSISFSDQGVLTNLSFADRPPQAPQMEGILNKIGPRTM